MLKFMTSAETYTLAKAFVNSGSKPSNGLPRAVQTVARGCRNAAYVKESKGLELGTGLAFSQVLSRENL
jgi:hypothetical protein